MLYDSQRFTRMIKKFSNHGNIYRCTFSMVNPFWRLLYPTWGCSAQEWREGFSNYVFWQGLSFLSSPFWGSSLPPFYKLEVDTLSQVFWFFCLFYILHLLLIVLYCSLSALILIMQPCALQVGLAYLENIMTLA